MRTAYRRIADGCPEWLWLLLIGMAMLLPFLHRPVFVDDHAHFAEAQDLGRHWKDLYRGGTHSLGWAAGASPGEANPPGYFYLVGALTRVAGSDPATSHAFIMAFALGGLLAFYGLARRYVAYPLWTALLWMCSPHYWLTENTLLLDALLGPALMMGLYFWIRGWSERRPAATTVGIFFLTLAPLIKYTGLIGWAVAAAWVLCESDSRKSWRWAWMLIPAAAFAAWLFWSHRIYGESHFLAVARGKIAVPGLSQLLLLFVFTAGATPALWLGGAARLTSQGPLSKKWPWILIALALATGMAVTPSLWTGLQLGFWLGGFLLWALAVIPGRSDVRQPERLFFLGWAAGALLLLAIAIPWICARYLVIAGPALILLTVKAVERWRPDWFHSLSWRRLTLAILLAVSWGLARADDLQAKADEHAAAWAETWRRTEAPQRAGYYPGAMLGGASYFLAPQGWKPLAPQARAPGGSLVFLTPRTLPRAFWPRLDGAPIVARQSIGTFNPFRTLDGPHNAAFYGSIWGCLPFSVSTQPIDVYTLVLAQ